MPWHTGKRGAIRGKVAADAVEDGQADAARFDANQHLAALRRSQLERLPLKRAAPFMDAVALNFHTAARSGATPKRDAAFPDVIAARSVAERSMADR